jgi:hypothetical protein
MSVWTDKAEARFPVSARGARIFGDGPYVLAFRRRGQFLFHDYFVRFIQNTVTAGAISQIHTNRHLVRFENLAPLDTSNVCAADA